MLWKLPGGHKQEGETPLHTAIRELEGETGIKASAERFQRIRSYAVNWPVPHQRVLFRCRITEEERDWLNDREYGNEGEQPKFFSVEEFRELARGRKILVVHREYLEENALVLLPEAPEAEWA